MPYPTNDDHPKTWISKMYVHNMLIISKISNISEW